MALNTVQIKTINTYLIKTYKNVSFDSAKKKITVSVDNADRTYRKGILKEIQKNFSAAPFNAKYTEPKSGGKTGEVNITGLKVEVKASLKAKPVSTGKAKFKPSDIVPSIVNEWLNSDEIIDNVKKYIKSVDLEKTVETEILDLLTKTGKDNSISIPFDAPKDLVPAEFFEVLTAVKLSVLLKNNDSRTRQILGIPKNMDLKKSKIKIYIPQQANFPLIDYYISITASEKKDPETSLRISVKSKVKTPKANTVKFKDLFDGKKDVADWYKSLNRSLQQQQKGPKTVAESAINVYTDYKGKFLFGVPIVAMMNLMKEDKVNITPLIKKEIGSYISFNDFESILKQIYVKMKTVTNDTDLTEVLDKKSYLKASNLIQSFMSKTGGKEVDNSVYNIAYVCERLLVSSSKENSSTKYNYYQMFFDEVLMKRKIAYAVSSMQGKTIKYNFYSLVNFTQEYASWLSLRSKNSPNSPSDVIGIDV